MNHIVIIGFGAAGYAAFRGIRRMEPDIPVTIIDPKPRHIMHPCGLPYALEGLADQSGLYEDLAAAGRPEIIQGRVIKIVPGKKYVNADVHGTIVEITYDRLIISSGNRPMLPPIEGLTAMLGRHLFTMTTVEDLKAIKRVLGNSSRAVVIGGGAIGLECAVALKTHVEDVSVYEKTGNILGGILDDDLEKQVREYLSSQGIPIYTECEITGFTGTRTCKGICVNDEEISSDLTILATGLLPDLSLAESVEDDEAGMDFDEYGIHVDTRLKTSIKDIYAAGDCISCWSIIDGKPVTSKLATPAYKQGTIAGMNAAGGDIEYLGTAGTFVTSLAGLEIAGTGYTSRLAQSIGYSPVTGKISCQVQPPYMINNNELTFKVIYDSLSDRVLGAQAAGKGAAERINIISSVLEFSIPMNELERIEMAYCPAVSDVHDPLTRAVEFARRRGGSHKALKKSTSIN